MKGVISIQEDIMIKNKKNNLIKTILNGIGIKVVKYTTEQIDNHTTLDIERKSNITSRIFNHKEHLHGDLKTVIIYSPSNTIDECKKQIIFANKTKTINDNHINIFNAVNINNIENKQSSNQQQLEIDSLLPIMDFVALEHQQLSRYTQVKINDFSDCVWSCKEIMKMGAKIVTTYYENPKGSIENSIILGFNSTCYIIKPPSDILNEISLYYFWSLINSLTIKELLNHASPIDAFKLANSTSHTLLRKIRTNDDLERNIGMINEYIVPVHKVSSIGKCVEDSSFIYYSC
ncbi:TPA: hypothetical protein AB5C37_003519 [Vibrio cholerae]